MTLIKNFGILIFICFLLFSFSPVNANTGKAEYPQNGLIHYFDFEGNFKDKVTGTKLVPMLPEKWNDRKPEFVKDDNGKETCLKTFPMLLRGNYSLERYPEISVIIRFRQDKEYDSEYTFDYLVAGNFRKNDVSWYFDEHYAFCLNKNNHPYIYTEDYKTEKTTEDGTETIKVKGMDGYLKRPELGKWNTMVFTVNRKDSTISLTNNGVKVVLNKFFPPYADKECTGMGFFKYSFNDKNDYRYPEGVIDDILIYNRIITDEETCMLQGVKSIEYRNPELTLMENIEDSIFLLFVLLICPILSLIFCVFRPKQLPEVKLDNMNAPMPDRSLPIDNDSDIQALNLGYKALHLMTRRFEAKSSINNMNDPDLVALIDATEVAPERIPFFRALSIRRKLLKAQKLLDKNVGVRFFISELTYIYNKAMRITFVGNIALLLIPFLLFFLPALTFNGEVNVGHAFGIAWDNIGAILFLMFLYIACSLGPACTFREDSEDVNEDIKYGFERLRIAFSKPGERLPQREGRLMFLSFLNQGAMAGINSIFLIGSVISGIIYTIYNLIFVVPYTIVSYGGKLFLRKDTLFPVIVIAILIGIGTSGTILSSLFGIIVIIAMFVYVIACWIAFIKNVIMRSFID